MRFTELFSDLAQDLRYAARGLARRPAFTSIAVVSLAIGIGATTAIFSAVNTILLRPLPFSDPSRLMKVSLVTPSSGRAASNTDMVWSYPKFLVFRDDQSVFESLSLHSAVQFNVTRGVPERIGGEMVDASYLPTLGISVERGSNFPSDEDAHPGAPKLALISHRFWERRFGGDASVVGKPLELEGTAFEVIGITAPGFQGVSGQADVFIPITTRDAGWLSQPQSHEFTLIARRKPGVTVEAAQSAVVLLGPRVAAALPPNTFLPGQWGAIARNLDSTRADPLVERSLVILLVSVALLLLLACANLANLLLARASSRRREIALRLALGARRGRLLRLLVTESVLISLAGGTVGLLIAWWGTSILADLNPASALAAKRLTGIGAVGFEGIHVDKTSLIFFLGVSIVVGIAFSIVPAFLATDLSAAEELRQGSTASRNADGTRRLLGRRMIVISEVALALILLVGSGLMGRSLANLLSIDPGFQAQGILTLRIGVPAAAYTRDSMPETYRQLVSRLSSLSGVTSASLGDCPPLSGGCNFTQIKMFDDPQADKSVNPSVGVHWITPKWFETLQVPVQHGRVFTDFDRIGSPKVVIVNMAAARQFWPREDPIGKRVGIDLGGFADGAEVVGVVGDVRSRIDSVARAEVYLPYEQSPQSRLMVFLRTSGNPTSVLAAARDAIHDIGPEFSEYDVRTMTARAGDAISRTRAGAVLLGLFACVALALATMGIYGVMVVSVAQRTPEFGIRLALGANPQTLMATVLKDGLMLVAIGSVIGVGAAAAFARVLRALLFGVGYSDLGTFVGIVTILTGAALMAVWIPARRATRIDPAIALRSD